jgi:Ca2+-binding EF-hand superfamily protein
MANSIFKQYDKNGDGVIDKDEMGQMPGGLRRADRNGDGKITREELIAQMVEFSQRRGGGPDGGPGGGRGGPPGAATATATNNGKPSKFRTALEMLPAGLPETFLQKDADHDGQVSMAEWTTAWSDEEAARFAKYDLNHDGIITAAEFLKIEGQAKVQARR